MAEIGSRFAVRLLNQVRDWLRATEHNLPAFVFRQNVHEERPIELQRPSGSMMAIDEHMALNDLAILRKEDMTHDTGNRRIDMRHVVAIHVARLNRKSQIVAIKLHGAPPIGHDFSCQIDVEDESTPHVIKPLSPVLATDRTTSLRDPLCHGPALECRS